MPYSRGLTDEQKAAVSERYKKDYNTLYTARDLGLTNETVRYHLKKTGQSKSRRVVTDSDRAEMARRYAEGESTWEIGKAMGFLNVCVIKNLKAFGVTLRDRSTAAKTYSVNQDYFREIDTPTKAYILGLIWADGNVHKDSFTLALKASDKPLLDAIRAELKSTGPLNFRKRQEPQMSDMWALRVHDKRFCDRLREKGVLACKTSKLRFPTHLSKHLFAPFILGVADGDGCISISGGRLSFMVAGADQMLLDLQQIIETETGMTMRFSRVEGSRGCRLTCGSTIAMTVLNYLYGSAPPFFMRRKYERYARFVSEMSRAHIRDHTAVQAEVADLIIHCHAA